MTNQDLNAGTCAVCGGLWMLTKRGRLVNHGFQRPGGGWQSGGCFGEKSLPYEHSTEVLVELIKIITLEKTNAESCLANLEAGPESIPDQVVYTPHLQLRPIIDKEHPNFTRSLQLSISRVKNQIDRCGCDIVNRQEQIDKWPGVQPLRHKPSDKKIPLVDLIQIGTEYQWYSHQVKALSKGPGDRVLLCLPDGSKRTTRARLLKPLVKNDN